MFEPSKYLEDLARVARQEKPPAGQSAEAVLRRLRAGQESEITRPLLAFTFGSVVLCAATVLVCMMASSSGSTDALSEFFQDQLYLTTWQWS